MPRPANDDTENRLFVGRLNFATDEDGLARYFEQFGELTDHIIMRHYDSMKSKGFGFVTFATAEGLERCMDRGTHTLDGSTLELSMATKRDEEADSQKISKGGKGASHDKDLERRLFVGKLDYATTDIMMGEHFRKYGTLYDCIVMRWPDSMKSRGFGFVTFMTNESLEKCLEDGPHLINGKEVELSRAAPKDSRGTFKADDPEEFDPESKPMRRLFLGRLNLSTTEDILEEYFQQFGEVEEANVMKYNDSGKSRGFGFITFNKAESVDKCQSSRPHTVDGKTIETRRATSRRDAKNPEAHIEVKKIWVGGFKEDMSDEDIEEYFGQFGQVNSVTQMKFNDSGKKRGFGFVVFDDTDIADKVCLIGIHALKGKRLEVKKALDKEHMAQVRSSSRNMDSMMNQYARSMGGGRGMMNDMEMSEMFSMFMQHMMTMNGGGGGSGGGMRGPSNFRGSSRMFDDDSWGGGGHSSGPLYSRREPNYGKGQYRERGGPSYDSYGRSGGRSGGGGGGGSGYGGYYGGSSGGPMRSSMRDMREAANPYSRGAYYARMGGRR